MSVPFLGPGRSLRVQHLRGQQSLALGAFCTQVTGVMLDF